jgi:hypothetical protein
VHLRAGAEDATIERSQLDPSFVGTSLAEPSTPSLERVSSAQQHPELLAALHHVRGRARLARGRGSYALSDLMARLHGDDTLKIDERTGEQLATLIESMLYAIEDAKSEARRNSHGFPGMLG